MWQSIVTNQNEILWIATINLLSITNFHYHALFYQTKIIQQSISMQQKGKSSDECTYNKLTNHYSGE